MFSVCMRANYVSLMLSGITVACLLMVKASLTVGAQSIQLGDTCPSNIHMNTRTTNFQAHVKR